MSIPPGYRNCHARGVNSVVLAFYPDGRPRLRMFTTTPEHTLWTNARPGAGEVPMSLAIHAHRSPITLTRIHGRPMQVEAAHCEMTLDASRRIRRWRYQSQILTGHGSFTPEGYACLAVREPYVFDCIRMEARDLHTIYVPRGEVAAWAVHEHELAPTYDEVLYSDDDLSAFDFTGMYEPMTSDEARAVVSDAFARAVS